MLENTDRPLTTARTIQACIQRFRFEEPTPPTNRQPPVPREAFWWIDQDVKQKDLDRSNSRTDFPLLDNPAVSSKPDISVLRNFSKTVESVEGLQCMTRPRRIDDLTDLDEYANSLLQKCDNLLHSYSATTQGDWTNNARLRSDDSDSSSDDDYTSSTKSFASMLSISNLFEGLPSAPSSTMSPPCEKKLSSTSSTASRLSSTSGASSESVSDSSSDPSLHQHSTEDSGNLKIAPLPSAEITPTGVDMIVIQQPSMSETSNFYSSVESEKSLFYLSSSGEFGESCRGSDFNTTLGSAVFHGAPVLLQRSSSVDELPNNGALESKSGSDLYRNEGTQGLTTQRLEVPKYTKANVESLAREVERIDGAVSRLHIGGGREVYNEVNNEDEDGGPHTPMMASQRPVTVDFDDRVVTEISNQDGQRYGNHSSEVLCYDGILFSKTSTGGGGESRKGLTDTVEQGTGTGVVLGDSPHAPHLYTSQALSGLSTDDIGPSDIADIFIPALMRASTNGDRSAGVMPDIDLHTNPSRLSQSQASFSASFAPASSDAILSFSCSPSAPSLPTTALRPTIDAALVSPHLQDPVVQRLWSRLIAVRQEMADMRGLSVRPYATNNAPASLIDASSASSSVATPTIQRGSIGVSI